MNQENHILLIRELRAGSCKAFNKLYALYADLLYGFILHLTKSPSEAKDILQETFLRIWQTKEHISTDASFKSYLYTIARNLMIDSFRRRLRSVAFDEYINSDAAQNYVDNGVEKEINLDEICAKLEQAKDKLTARQRQIVELNKEEGFSISDIAAQLHLSKKTVKNQLSMGMKTLRAEFANLLYNM
ncbi:MAG: RNA polymerase sigma factor [Tannerellaceae bacterium]|nr:RNA polymerase sigma factor [Tannerellaceae bacterium]